MLSRLIHIMGTEKNVSGGSWGASGDAVDKVKGWFSGLGGKKDDEPKTPEEKIIALAELGKSELQYNELDRIRNNLKIHLENAIGREPENSRESQTAYEDGRLLDALALLPLTTTQSPGKIYPYLFLLSALLLVIIYLKRDAIFNTKKESAITRIEKKIQLRNS